jgi:hypothetical protein
LPSLFLSPSLFSSFSCFPPCGSTPAHGQASVLIPSGVRTRALSEGTSPAERSPAPRIPSTSARSRSRRGGVSQLQHLQREPESGSRPAGCDPLVHSMTIGTTPRSTRAPSAGRVMFHARSPAWRPPRFQEGWETQPRWSQIAGSRNPRGETGSAVRRQTIELEPSRMSRTWRCRIRCDHLEVDCPSEPEERVVRPMRGCSPPVVGAMPRLLRTCSTPAASEGAVITMWSREDRFTQRPARRAS